MGQFKHIEDPKSGSPITVNDDGKLSIVLPAFSQDIAVKVNFLGARAPSVQSTAGWSGTTAEPGK